MYGTYTEGINSGIPIDTFLATWYLEKYTQTNEIEISTISDLKTDDLIFGVFENKVFNTYKKLPEKVAVEIPNLDKPEPISEWVNNRMSE